MKKIQCIFAALCILSLFSITSCKATNSTNNFSSAVSEIIDMETNEFTAMITEEIPLHTDTEKELHRDIQILLNKFCDFSYSYLECKEVRECINENRFITTQEISDNGLNEGNTYEKKWYEIVNGEVLSVNDLNSRMAELFSEEMIGELDVENYYLEQDGKLYLSEFAGNDGGLLGTDITYITSVEATDNNIIIVNMTAFGDKNNWELPEDFTEHFTVELTMTENGLKISKCDISARSYITWTYSSENDIF